MLLCYLYHSGMKCGVSETNLKMSLLMYSSYFVLFARFFYNTYVGSKAGKNGKSKASSAGEIILKMEKKILQQTDEITKGPSDKQAFAQEIKNIKNCEYSQPQADNESKEEIEKSNQEHSGKSINENEAKEAEENISNKQIDRGDSSNKGTQQKDNSEVKTFDKETNEGSLDDRKVNDNINATTTRQK